MRKHLRILLLSILVCWGEGSSALEEEDYCQFSQEHTLCQFKNRISESCGNVTYRGIKDQAEKNIIVQIHNELRSKIANGLEDRGDPGPQPSAANMIELTWDDELALEAQTWADQCIIDHDCPSCRKLSRFPVGQNLYSFGHIPGIFEGSWKRAITGWYDEVIDFSRNHVDPFNIRKGVLVGHFTQLIWGSTSKIGCGRLTYFSEESKSLGYGQQLYICNYGRAGNYIGTRLYQIGSPCSKCPVGSKCSLNYPGLCTLDPSLSVIPIDIPAPPPPSVSIFGTNGSFQSTPPPEDENARCDYECKQNLGCSVFIKTTGIVNGPTLGSCFPPFFGGKCSGTPKDCVDCSTICKNSNVGQRVSIAVKRPDDVIRTPLERSSTETSLEASRNTCDYTCKGTGGCSVRLNSNKPLSGSVLGSCFSPAFGGKCFGTPRGCTSCLKKCVGKEGESFSEII